MTIPYFPFLHNSKFKFHGHPIEVFLNAIKADIVRLGGESTITSFIQSILFDRTFRPVFTMRLCQALKRSRRFRRLWFFARILHGFATHTAGIDLPWDTQIGLGFRITHGWGLVISSKAVIGHNVTVFHGVTIGRKDTIGPENERTVYYPIIGDEVWIGPYAVIVGQIHIGNGARIAAGTIVTNDVQPHTIVGGNPMRVIRENAPADVMYPAEIV